MAAGLANVDCPAIMVVAPGFHQGRTTVTAALARYHRNQGRRVKVFKAGPDFLDPLLHQCASGDTVDTLDLWLVGEAKCRYLLYQAALTADLILIECSVGLYDTQPTCLQLAEMFSVPMMIVVDGSSVKQAAQDFVDDLVTLEADLPVAGVLLNRVDPDYRPEAVKMRLREGVRYVGHLPFDESLSLPVEQQSLLDPGAIAALDRRLNEAADMLERNAIIPLPDVVTFKPAPQPQMPPLLDEMRIGIAKDEAFGFIYPGNLRLLESMGATLTFFSPIHDSTLPDVDSLWFPGGFPELYLQPLSANHAMKASIREFHAQGKSILAECGGMLYMMGSLIGASGDESRMVGLLPGRGLMLDHLAGLGMKSVQVDDQTIRGHVFHHSRMESGMEPVSVSDRRHGRRPSETLYHLDGLYASFVHFYFPSNPLLTARFLGSPIFNNPDY